MFYSNKLVKMMIENKAPEAAREVGIEYNNEVNKAIELELHNSFFISDTQSIETIENSVDHSIRYWKENIKNTSKRI